LKPHIYSGHRSGIFIIYNNEHAHELKEITKFLNVAVCRGCTNRC